MRTLCAIPMMPKSPSLPGFHSHWLEKRNDSVNFRGVGETYETESQEMNSACLPQELKHLTFPHATCTANVLIFPMGEEAQTRM